MSVFLFSGSTLDLFMLTSIFIYFLFHFFSYVVLSYPLLFLSSKYCM